MGKTNPFSKPLIYIMTIIYIVTGFATLSMGSRVANFVFREDHYFENVGAISFFAAAILFFSCFILSVRSPAPGRLSIIKPLIFLGLAIMFFFAGGEEISWGQRILQVQTPGELLAINQQGETNVHNLKVFKDIRFSFETAFDVLWLSFTVLLPLFALFKGEFVGQFIPIPHLGIGLLFLFNYVWAKVAKLIYPTSYTFDIITFGQAVQEVKESNYSLLFAFVGFYLLLQLLGLCAGEPRAVRELRPSPIDDGRKA